MSNAIIPFNTANVPAAARARMASQGGIAKNVSDGVGSAMNVLSIKGKNFREKILGEFIVTPKPMYEFDVIILDGTPNLNKTYFINQYVDGEMAPPDCWSLNSVKPDPQAPAKQATTCRACKWNVFGSRISDRPGQPSKAKACADSRRIAVFPAHMLGQEFDPELLRVPATSLKPLKEYVTELERMGIPANTVVTRLSFEQVPHPQLQFTAVGILNDEQYSQIDWLLRRETTTEGIDQYGHEPLRRILEAPMQDEDIDPSEVSGTNITNRNDAPPPHPQAAAPPAAGQWSPPGQQVPQTPPQPAAQPAAVAPQPQTQDEIIPLPDGSFFNKTKGVIIPAPPPAAPARPASVIDLPDGKMLDQATGQYWTAPDVAPQSNTPPAAPAGVPPRPVPTTAIPPNSARAAPAPQPSYKPVPAAVPNGKGGWSSPQAAEPTPGQQWKPAANPMPEGTPQFLHPKTIEGTATEVQAEQAAPAPAPTPKPRKTTPAPSTAAVDGGAQAAPAELDALLSELSLT